MSWLTPLLHQDQNELLGGGKLELHKLCEAASLWPDVGFFLLSWEHMKDCFSVLYFS